MVHTKLTEVIPLKRFVDEAKLFCGRIVVSHFLTETADRITVTHRIEMRGFLAFFYAFVMGSGMKKNLPMEMRAMIQRAEAK